MTIDIDVHCKQAPEWNDLVAPLNWEETDYLPNCACFKWIPKGCKSHIYIYFKRDSSNPEVYSCGYDKETIDDMVVAAKEKKIAVPDGLIQKFLRDNDLSEPIVTARVASAQDSGPNNPILVPATAEEGYSVKADKELYRFLCEYPDLMHAFPLLKTEFTLAKFSQGLPLHTVGLEAKVFAPREVIASMVGLASYFAKAFDGIIYEDQTNEFGIPDADRLHSIGMDVFLAVAEDARKRNGKITPFAF